MDKTLAQERYVTLRAHAVNVSFLHQVHLRPPEEQTPHPGHAPAAVPESSQPDPGPQGGGFYTLTSYVAWTHERVSPSDTQKNLS